MNLAKGIALLGLSIIMFGVATWIAVHCFAHIGESGEASASFADFGSITGSPHLVGLVISFGMMSFSLRTLWKTPIGNGEPQRQVVRWKSRITAKGLEIAEKIRRNKS